MNIKEKYPEFKDLTKEKFKAILAEYQKQLGVLQQLEIEHQENQKTIAELCARKAYLDEMKRTK
jgi:hypothetical protein